MQRVLGNHPRGSRNEPRREQYQRFHVVARMEPVEYEFHVLCVDYPGFACQRAVAEHHYLVLRGTFRQPDKYPYVIERHIPVGIDDPAVELGYVVEPRHHVFQRIFVDKSLPGIPALFENLQMRDFVVMVYVICTRITCGIIIGR